MADQNVHVFLAPPKKERGRRWYNLRNTAAPYTSASVSASVTITINPLKAKITPSIVSLRSWTADKSRDASVTIKASGHLSRIVNGVPNENQIILRIHPIKDE